MTSVKVTVPEVKRKFDTKVPNHTPAKWPEKDQNKPIIKWNEKEIKVENPINIKLAEQYVMAKDSIERLNLYLKSIRLNQFSKSFEDDNIKIDINGIVQGEVKEVTPNYTIKERKLEVPVQAKETTFRVLAGIEVGNNTALNDFKAKANLMFQNRKGNVLTASFDTNQTIWVGYNFSILNIKR